MASGRIEPIEVENLNLTLKNPRYPGQSNQRSAIETLAKEQGLKLLNLAEDIAKYGSLDPTQLILVEESPTPDIYTVLEGNRRVASLKLLHTPSLLTSIDLSKRIKDRFRYLHDTYAATLPRRVNCSILTRAEAEHWIFLRHTGANNGVGVVNWDGIATQRFRGGSPALQALDTIATSGLLDPEILARLNKVPISTLRRIFANVEARKPLGVVVKGDVYSYIENPDVVNRRLATIIIDLITKRIRTGDVYHSDQITTYVKDVAARVNAEFADSKELEDSDDESQHIDMREFDSEVEVINQLVHLNNDELEPEDTGPTPREKLELPKEPTISGLDSEPPDDESLIELSLPPEVGVNPTVVPVPLPGLLATTPPTGLPVANPPRRINPSRDTLMPSNFRLRIQELRLNKMYHELRDLNVESFPNSVSVMFRVFIELSLDAYAARNGILLTRPLTGPVPPKPIKAPDMNLGEKIRTIAQVLLDGGKISLGLYNLLDAWSKDHNTKHSLDFLHEYIHNKDASPVPSDLKAQWDQIQEFVRQLHT